MKKQWIVIGTVVVGVSFSVCYGSMDSWVELQSDIASDTAIGDGFGNSAAACGDTAIIGAPGDDDMAMSAGAAYIFNRDGTAWVEGQKLTASDSVWGDLFGSSVAISGDTAIVGTPGEIDDKDYAGTAYLFQRDEGTWSQGQKLAPADGADDDQFGWSVAIDGDYAIVGAYYNNSKGSAYLYKRDGAAWSMQQKLIPADSGGQFGYCVSIDGDTAVVGSRTNSNTNGTAAGAAYVYKREGVTWTLQQKLIAADGAAGDYFGGSISICGDTVLAGAAEDAYMFQREGTTWTEQQKLTASDPSALDRFGISVSIGAGYAVVGAEQKDIARGASYLFKYNGTAWVHQQKMTASDGADNDRYGHSVAIRTAANSYFAFVGAHTKNSSAGRMYVLGFSPSADTNHDCTVNLADLAIFAQWWLYGTE